MTNKDSVSYAEYIAEQLYNKISYGDYIVDSFSETEQEKLARERKEVRELRNKKLERIFKDGN
jgi:hypothetical protein